MSTPRAIVVMGVSGCGKSTLARGLAHALDYRFIEADELHSPASVAKMQAGVPLDDSDRWPWLEMLAEALDQGLEEHGSVAACSALRRSYRDLIRQRCRQPVTFVHLELDHDALLARMGNRPGHFMPASLLNSQLATLERPTAEHGVLTIDAVAYAAADQLEQVLVQLRRM